MSAFEPAKTIWEAQEGTVSVVSVTDPSGGSRLTESQSMGDRNSFTKVSLVVA